MRNLTIFGCGELGGKLYFEFQREQELFDRFYLIGRDLEKPNSWVSLAKQSFRKTYDTKIYTDARLEKVISESTVFVFTASKNDRFNLEQNTQSNLSIIRKVAPFFPKNYSGTIIIASNQTDTLCYEFAERSLVNPYRIIGFNGLDYRRARNDISIFVDEEIEIKPCIIGPHHNSILLPEKSYVNNRTLDFLLDDYELQMINESRNNSARKIIKGLGTTNDLAATALRELIQIIINGGEDTVSTIYQHRNQRLYTGMPVKFKNQQAIITLEKLNELEQIQFNLILDAFVSEFLEKFDLLKSENLSVEQMIQKAMYTNLPEQNKLLEQIRNINQRNIFQ